MWVYFLPDDAEAFGPLNTDKQSEEAINRSSRRVSYNGTWLIILFHVDHHQVTNYSRKMQVYFLPDDAEAFGQLNTGKQSEEATNRSSRRVSYNRTLRLLLRT